MGNNPQQRVEKSLPDDKAQMVEPLEHLTTFPKISYANITKRDPTEMRKLAYVMFKSGFMILTEHGVNKELQADLWDQFPLFFNSSVANKSSCKTGEINGAYGWDNNENLGQGLDVGESDLGTRDLDGKEKTSRNVKDLKECLTLRIGPPKNPFAFKWPEEPKDLRKVGETFIREMERLTLEMLKAMFEIMGTQFEEDGYYNEHMGCLRLNWYPHQGDDTKPEPGQIRCAEHTDYGPITILKADQGGLEAFLDNQWMPVPTTDKNDFVVNFGDTLMRWSNNKVLATLHRVVNPEFSSSESTKDNTRKSAAWFFNCNADALIKTLPSCIDEAQPDCYSGKSITQQKLVMAKHNGSKVVHGNE